MRRRRTAGTGFTVVELLVVLFIMAVVFFFLFKGMRGSKESAERAERLDVTRAARVMTDRLTRELSRASILAAPAYGEAALTLVFYDDHHHRIQYLNRTADGRDVFTLADAKNSAPLRLVRLEAVGEGPPTVTILGNDDALQYVVFRRLGRRLVGFEIQFDPEKAGKKTPNEACYVASVALERHFN